MNANVLDGYQLTVTELRTPNGEPLPVVEVTFITVSDPDKPAPMQWPTIRIRPRDMPLLIQKLQTALERAQSQNYDGPNRIQ